VGLAETKKFAEGYDAIFGKKQPERPKAAPKAKRKGTARGKKPKK
jgi:hypothetical protein